MKFPARGSGVGGGGGSWKHTSTGGLNSPVRQQQQQQQMIDKQQPEQMQQAHSQMLSFTSSSGVGGSPLSEAQLMYPDDRGVIDTLTSRRQPSLSGRGGPVALSSVGLNPETVGPMRDDEMAGVAIPPVAMGGTMPPINTGGTPDTLPGLGPARGESEPNACRADTASRPPVGGSADKAGAANAQPPGRGHSKRTRRC